MSSSDPHPDFLPGDRNPPPDKLVVPEPPPPPPSRRYPLPLLIFGAVLAAVVVVGVFLLIRVNLGDPATPDPAPESEPGITLTPRSGTPAPVQTIRPGDRVQVQGLYGAGSVLVARAEWSDTGDLAPSEGRMYLNVELRYDVTEGSMFIHPNHYTAYDLAQNEYYPGIGSGKPQFAPQEIKAGQSATGWVSIELPPDQSFFAITDEGINPLVMVEVPKP